MAPPGYTVVMDASVTGVRAAQVMEQLARGGFMDEAARRATFQVPSRVHTKHFCEKTFAHVHALEFTESHSQSLTL